MVLGPSSLVGLRKLIIVVNIRRESNVSYIETSRHGRPSKYGLNKLKMRWEWQQANLDYNHRKVEAICI